jgi:hypothetical protein
MPRKPNYGFDKRRKEQDRKAKKDAKRLERQQRRDAEGPEVPEPGTRDEVTGKMIEETPPQNES